MYILDLSKTLTYMWGVGGGGWVGGILSEFYSQFLLQLVHFLIETQVSDVAHIGLLFIVVQWVWKQI